MHTINLDPINPFDPMKEPLHFPKIKKKCKITQDNVFNTAFFLNVSISILSFLMILSLCISGIVIYRDVSLILGDTKNTLNNLQVVLPEVHTTMKMLQNLCNTPEFKRYCFPE